MDLTSLGRIPPQNIEAEQSVLGSMITDKEIIPDIVSTIKVDDFYKEGHKVIFECICELFNKNQPVDLITISELLNLKGYLDEIGGLSYLAEISTSVPTTANAKYYATIIEEKSVRRQAIKKSSEIIDKAYNSEFENAVEIKSNALEILSEINVNDSSKNRNIITVAKDFEENINRKRTLDNESEEKYYTGITEYDYWLDGLHEQEFTIIGARPAVGKTAFGLQIAKNLAKKGLHIPFITLEMSDTQLFSRIVSSESKINSHKLRKPKLMSDDDFKSYLKISKQIANLPLYIEDIKYLQDLRAYCRQMKMKKRLDALFVDYIQLMLTYKKTNNRNEELGDISRNLKSISKEFNIPVIALAQLSRLSERDNREPKLSDLRESGDMEQDADNVIFLHKPSSCDELASIQDRKVIIAKQRNGSTGYFNLLFEGKTFNFMNVDKQKEYKIRKEEL